MAFALAACATSGRAQPVESARLKCHIAITGKLRDCYALDGLDAAHAAPWIKQAEEDFTHRPVIVDGRAVEVWAIITMNKFAPEDDAGALASDASAD